MKAAKIRTAKTPAKKTAAKGVAKRKSTSENAELFLRWCNILFGSNRELADRAERIIRTLTRIMDLKPGTRYMLVRDRDGILTGVIIDCGQRWNLPRRLAKRYGGWRVRGADTGNGRQVKRARAV